MTTESKASHRLRPVQVQFMSVSYLVEHDPSGMASARAIKAHQEMNKALERGDIVALIAAHVDYLADRLRGWSLGPGKPTREALSRMPAGWLAAAIVAIGDDAAEYIKETEG